MICYPRRVCFPLLLALLLIGAALRFWALPARYDIRDGDERDYLAGGLDVFQGMPPTLHYAPAGVETWWGWAHAGALSARYMIRPTAEELEVPSQLRPFVAINHALFDLYRDMSGLRREYDLLAIGVGLCAIVAGFRIGMRWAGLHGAVLVGGLLAVVPLLIQLGALAKPYAMAWSFAVISFYFLARRNRRRIASAIFLGLAISSRVEMLTVLPLAWLLIWPRQESIKGYLANCVRYTCAAGIATLLVAPWLLTNLMGNFRAIATIRFAPPTAAAASKLETIRELSLYQGLGIVLLILAFGLIATLFKTREPAPPVDPANPPPPAEPQWSRFWSWLVLAFGAVLVFEIFHDTGYGLRHHGPAVIGILVIAGLAIAPLAQRWPCAAWAAVIAALAFPLAHTARATWVYHRAYVPDEATAWIEAHLPPGTTLYLYPTLKDPLPTPASADAAWDEVMRRDAAVRKFQAATRRFNLTDFEPPRGVADQNMMTERGGARRYYVLGGRSRFAGPRFDIHYNNSSVFGTLDPVAAFKKTGGAYLYRGDAPLPELAPQFVQSWASPGKRGTWIYVSPDVKLNLIP